MQSVRERSRSDDAPGYHMPITKLSFSNVGPFDDIEFEFDPQVNVFTGPNNSGKSTVLWVLGGLLVYPFGTPDKSIRSDLPPWSLEVSSTAGTDSFGGTLPAEADLLLNAYAKIGFTSYIPALRQPTNFRSQGPTTSQDLEARVDEELEALYQDLPADARKMGPDALRQAWRFSAQVPLEAPELAKRRKLMLSGSSLVRDNAIKQKIVDLDYASYRKSRPSIRDTIDIVALVATEITEGYKIRFLKVGEDAEGLFPEFQTPDGDLPLDVLSQGTQSIIQFLARLIFGYAEYYDFPKALEDKPGVLIIDEIDAHLHPSWQMRIIPALTKHFPSLQIFCSTHSPLMLAGLKEGQVQLLQRDEKTNKVTVSRNEDDLVAWSADEILRNFLGVRDPTDWETVKDLERLRELQGKQDLSAEESKELESLSEAVSEDLLSGPVAAQVDRFIQALEQAKTGGDL